MEGSSVRKRRSWRESPWKGEGLWMGGKVGEKEKEGLLAQNGWRWKEPPWRRRAHKWAWRRMRSR